MATNDPKAIDKYIANFPEAIQQRLTAIRETIQRAAPDAQEVLSYGMPAYKYYGMLVYFAAHKQHIGLYPYPSAMEQFVKELLPYKTSKSTVQFPYDKELPLVLVDKLVRFRMEENKAKALAKKAKK